MIDVEKFKASMMKLAAVAEQLNEASDALSHEVQNIEDAFNRMRIGVEVWVTVNKKFRLGYGRHEGKWGLLVQSGEEGKYNRLVNSSRSIKIDAISAMPDLLIEFKRKVDILIVKMKDATEQVHEYNEEIKNNE